MKFAAVMITAGPPRVKADRNLSVAILAYRTTITVALAKGAGVAVTWYFVCADKNGLNVGCICEDFDGLRRERAGATIGCGFILYPDDADSESDEYFEAVSMQYCCECMQA